MGTFSTNIQVIIFNMLQSAILIKDKFEVHQICSSTAKKYP